MTTICWDGTVLAADSQEGGRVMMMLFGWTWDQWAIAAARYPRDPPKSYGDALRLKRHWMLANVTAPGEIEIHMYGQTPKAHEYPVVLFSLNPSVLMVQP